MNILKVIVDEVPEGCGYCKFEKPKADEINAWSECLVYNKVMTYHCYPPPDWCPLMSWEKHVKEMNAGLDTYLGLDELNDAVESEK